MAARHMRVPGEKSRARARVRASATASLSALYLCTLALRNFTDRLCVVLVADRLRVMLVGA